MNTRVFLGRNLRRDGSLSWSDGAVTLRETPNEFIGHLCVNSAEVQLTIRKKNKSLRELESDLLEAAQTLQQFLGEVHEQGALCMTAPRWMTPRATEHWWKDDADLIDNIEDYLKLVFERSNSGSEALDCVRSLLSSYTTAMGTTEELVVTLEGRVLQVYPKSLEHHLKNIELSRNPKGWSAILHTHQGGFHSDCIEIEAPNSPAAMLLLADEYRKRFS